MAHMGYGISRGNDSDTLTRQKDWKVISFELSPRPWGWTPAMPLG